MEQKKKFVTPCILHEVGMQLECGVLLGSTFTDTVTVQSTGQEVKEWEFTPSDDSPFNHEWGE